MRGLEGAWVRKDGSTLFVRESARLIRDETGQPLYYDGTVEDVTELVLARRAREQQERLLAIAGRMANLGGWYVDLATDQVLWSDEVAAIHEVPPGTYPSVEERISFYVPEHQARIREVFTACATEGIPYDVELQIITRSGRRVWVRTIGEPVRDAAGRIVGVQGALQDITDRKRAEDDLRESAKRYRELVEDISDVIIAIDADGTVTYISPVAHALGGYSPDEIVGQPFARFIHPDDLPGLYRAFQETLSGREPAPFEHRVIAKSGDPIWARTLTKPFFRDGKPAGVRGVMSDISARKRAEAELAESYARIQHLFDAIVDALASTIELRDPYTAGHQRRVAELAVAIARELGLSAEEQTGLRIAGLVHDVGKIVVPSEILSKPGRLSPLEMDMVRVHPEAGFNVLQGIDFPWPVAEVVHQHHERLDGSGYPQGLAGDEILLGARILAVADVVEAISSHRPYRAALGIEAALAEVEAGRGKLYDPQVVDACRYSVTGSPSAPPVRRGEPHPGPSRLPRLPLGRREDLPPHQSREVRGDPRRLDPGPRDVLCGGDPRQDEGRVHPQALGADDVRLQPVPDHQRLGRADPQCGQAHAVRDGRGLADHERGGEPHPLQRPHDRPGPRDEASRGGVGRITVRSQEPRSREERLEGVGELVVGQGAVHPHHDPLRLCGFHVPMAGEGHLRGDPPLTEVPELHRADLLPQVVGRDVTTRDHLRRAHGEPPFAQSPCHSQAGLGGVVREEGHRASVAKGR